MHPYIYFIAFSPMCFNEYNGTPHRSSDTWINHINVCMLESTKVQILYTTDILKDHTSLLWTNVFNINGQIDCGTKMQSVGE